MDPRKRITQPPPQSESGRSSVLRRGEIRATARTRPGEESISISASYSASGGEEDSASVSMEKSAGGSTSEPSEYEGAQPCKECEVNRATKYGYCASCHERIKGDHDRDEAKDYRAVKKSVLGSITKNPQVAVDAAAAGLMAAGAAKHMFGHIKDVGAKWLAARKQAKQNIVPTAKSEGSSEDRETARMARRVRERDEAELAQIPQRESSGEHHYEGSVPNVSDTKKAEELSKPAESPAQERFMQGIKHGWKPTHGKYKGKKLPSKADAKRVLGEGE